MLIKAGLITFGLLVLIILIFTLLFRQTGENKPQNPYRGQRDDNSSNREYKTFEVDEVNEVKDVKEVKGEEELPGEQPSPDLNNNSQRDIEERPKDFKL